MRRRIQPSGRAATAALLTGLALALGACGGDDEGDERAATTDAPPADTAPATDDGPETDAAPFEPAAALSGDELVSCARGRDVDVARESEAPEVDPVENGIVHDRLVVGPSDAPVLRVRLFAATDIAREQGALVKEVTPETEVLGTIVLEPLGEADAERQVVLDCLREQAGG